MANKKGNSYIIDKENGIAQIELTRRDGTILWTKIDLEDLDRVINFPYTWSAKYDPDLEQYYVEATVHRKLIEEGYSKAMKLHKFVMNVNDDRVVDHINHDTLDNTKTNLRVISHSNKSTNRKSRNSNNKSGYRNVCWDKKNDRWIVQLSVNGKNKCFGRFPKDQLDEAGKFAEQMRKTIYGEEFAGGN